ncbi:hypothetical protein GOP47_0014720 [Adiantum capillus-veneris]|uniref:Plastid lipid-associated protein/fibrillin conserved domain-containing protein n=1 Tax=Adiantum capillus-veneris TaxID=13818 RepID=A0A9D4UMV7_ADICA|nr:hypothetical protein GOP47_0014720 [Adiantum capillus-veneris]
MEVASGAVKPILASTEGLVSRPSRHGGCRLHIRPLQCSARSLSSTSSSSSSEAALARDDLLLLISDQQRGLATQKDSNKRAQIIRVIDSLAALGTDMTTTSHQSLSATWRMLWTTEKEQLFIIEKAHLFGTQAGDILQVQVDYVFLFKTSLYQSLKFAHDLVIDVEGKKLNNIITFPPDGAFFVDSTIEVVNSQRVNFRFTAAALRGSGWSIPVPPFGQGWFESVYIDEKIRVAKDIRGDYLVVDRAPYAWNG